MGLSYRSGTTPLAVNPSKVIEDKILIKLNNGSGAGGGGTGSVLNGHGAPSANPGVSAALYTDLDTGNLWSWNGAAWQ